jgi:hypothetical protein
MGKSFQQWLAAEEHLVQMDYLTLAAVAAELHLELADLADLEFLLFVIQKRQLVDKNILIKEAA